MAVDASAGSSKKATIAFTLPISCQVCLGKVKNPVLCPNNHVFCSPCMEVWLEKNKQCPACRVAMTTSKKILGGVSQQEGGDRDKMTNPELRKARFDLLYKEYENEFERMQSEVALLKTENQILKQQVRRDGAQDYRAGSQSDSSTKSGDTGSLLMLTKKLQDATKLYEKVKSELTRLKQENTNMKDENVSLNLENQNLRAELAGRSPHRYGRITVSTLESKNASYEKEVSRLNKALERSDKYIEELQAELETYRGKKTSSRDDKYSYTNQNGNADHVTRGSVSDSKVVPSGDYERGDNSSRRQLFTERKRTAVPAESASSAGESSKYYYSRNGEDREIGRKDDYADRVRREEYDDRDRRNDYGYSDRSYGDDSGKTTAGKGAKRVTFNLRRETNETASFDLEMPSPLKNSGNRSGLSNGASSPVKGVLKNGKKKAASSASGSGSDPSRPKLLDSYSADMSKSQTTGDDTLSSSYTKPASRYSKDDDLLYMKGRSSYSSRRYDEEEATSRPRSKYSADDSVLSVPSDSERKRPSSTKADYDDKEVDLDDTQLIESELDDLNISLTPEFTDCMKLLNRAEKNVHHIDSDSDDEKPYSYKPLSGRDTDFRASTGSTNLRPSTGSSDFRTSTGSTDFRTSTGSLDFRTSTGSSDFRTSTGSSDFRTATGSTDVRTSTGSTDFRASTGSTDFRASTGSTDFMSVDSYKSSYKSGGDDAPAYPASLDSYSRGKHVRSGSLDNLLTGTAAGAAGYREENALPASSNVYPSSLGSDVKTNYGATGAAATSTRMGRSPSLDNLLLARQSLGHSNRYSSMDDISGGYKSRLSLPGYLGSRPYHGESGDDKLDVKSAVASGAGSGTRGASGEGMGMQPGTKYDEAPTGRTRSYSDLGSSVSALAARNGVDAERKATSAGRLTPTVPVTVNDFSTDRKVPPGRLLSSVQGTNSDLSSLTSKPLPDKFTLKSSSTGGRLTPTLPSTNTDYSSNTAPALSKYDYTGSGPLSVPADISHKPPIAGRPYDSLPASSRLPVPAPASAYSNSAQFTSSIPDHSTASSAYSSGVPSYPTSSMAYTSSREPGPSNTGAGTGSGSTYSSGKYDPSLLRSDSSAGLVARQSELDSVQSRGVTSDARYSSASSNQHVDDFIYNTDFRSSSKSSTDNVAYVPSASSNSASTLSSIPGPAPASAMGYDRPVGLSSTSYASSSSYIPKTLTSVTSSTSYSTAHSLPMTHTDPSSSAYSSTRPTNLLSSKPMEPITEASHYSYVSNMSGDFSSKQSDTFALPEPKKRLFDSTDDLNLSVSPIKANRRY